MTVNGIDPILEKTLNETITSNQFTGDWEKLAPMIKTRIRQIITSHYHYYEDKTSNHDANTEDKESKPDGQIIESMIEGLDNILDQRFNKSPPFTILRISELLLFDSFPSNQISTKIMYENSPIKFLRALWLSFNVVTTEEEFAKRRNFHGQTVNSTPAAGVLAGANNNGNIDRVKILPIQTERGGETKTVVMTRISWLDEVDDEEDDDDDYVEGNDDDNSGSESDITDNDDESQKSTNSEENGLEDVALDGIAVGAKNPQVGKLIDAELGAHSPKTRREQLDSPNVKRRKSDINIKEVDETDISMTSIGEEDTDEKEISKDDIKMKDTSIEEEDLSKEESSHLSENLLPVEP